MKDYSCHVFIAPSPPPDWFKPTDIGKEYITKWLDAYREVVYEYYLGNWNTITYEGCLDYAAAKMRNIVNIMGHKD